MRPMMSMLAPGLNGTTARMTLSFGQPFAKAAREAEAKATDTMTFKRRRRFISPSLFSRRQDSACLSSSDSCLSSIVVYGFRTDQISGPQTQDSPSIAFVASAEAPHALTDLRKFVPNASNFRLICIKTNSLHGGFPSRHAAFHHRRSDREDIG